MNRTRFMWNLFARVAVLLCAIAVAIGLIGHGTMVGVAADAIGIACAVVGIGCALADEMGW